MRGRGTRRRGSVLFGLGCATVAYTYAGYPLLVGWLARRCSQAPQVVETEPLPTMSVVVAALDEADVIGDKIDDLRAQDYEEDRLEIIVVADGSSDATQQVAAAKGVKVLFDPLREGKSAAVNRGVDAATGDIVCLTDANCVLAPGSLRAISAAFADPLVAVASGAKAVYGAGARGSGEGLYWRIESFVQQRESLLGATMSGPGELLAVRRAATRPIPAGVINDDYHLVCDALVRGLRTCYEPRAVAREEVSPSLGEELERRTRIAAGTWQTTLAHFRLVDPRRGFVALAFASHRVLRSLVVPFLLPLLWCASFVAGRRRATARLLFGLQTCVYAAAALGAVRDDSILAAPFQLALVNVATMRGAFRFLTRRQPVAWKRVSRSTT